MRTLGLLAAALIGCTAAQVDAVDPVTYVDGQTCPDAHGVQQKVTAGFFCCAGPPSYAGPGQCEDGTSCMAPDTCSSVLPDNDEAFMARVAVRKRAGL